MKLFGLQITRDKSEPTASDAIGETLPTIDVADLPTASDGFYRSVANFAHFDGDKFPGGFGDTKVLLPDYWTLRNRSKQLFTENLYARGLIRRLVTNEINTGLSLEAMPDEQTLGLPLGGLDEWAENTENRFTLWGRSAELCDWSARRTFGEIQAEIRSEALVEGDALVVLRIDPTTLLPLVQIISGSRVMSPITTSPQNERANIVHGVELDDRRRHVAYHVQLPDGRFERIPAYGPNSGRRVAWLVYGSDKLHDDVRGQPLLALVLQSLREIDRYRDSVQRKAVVNSILAMFIKKTADKPGTRPLTGGAVRRDQTIVNDGTPEARRYDFTQSIPGMVIQELQQGEEPVGFNSTGTDLSFATFESAILRTIAWSNEVPPEILELSFEKNYSASQAALNEFKVYLNRVRARHGWQLCDPIYREWLIGQVLTRKIRAEGLIEAIRDPLRYDLREAWFVAEWCGQIKPSTDMLKMAKAYDQMIQIGAITRARATREMTGTKFSRNVQQLLRENKQIAGANEVLTTAMGGANVRDDDPAKPDDEGDE